MKTTSPQGASKNRFHFVVYTLLIAAALVVVGRFALTDRNHATRSTPNPAEAPSLFAGAPSGPGTNPPAADMGQAPSSPVAGAQSVGAPERLRALTAALRTNLTTGAGNVAARLAEQLALADERALIMTKLMAQDPAQALASSLSFAEYAALEPEVQRRVERPFSVKGNFDAFPVCPDDGHGPADAGVGAATASYTVRTEGTAAAWPSYVLRRRGGTGSKVGIPFQGIELQGQAVLRDEVMQVLDARDAEAARTAFSMTVANTDPARDFLTGEPIAAERVTAAAGGRLYLFANLANAARLNEELARMEAKPGPHTGSQVLLRARPFDPAGAAGGFDLQGAWEATEFAASAWTETKKKVYIIRVDFPDLINALVSKSVIEGVFHGAVSNQLFNMSYGKTWTEAVASPSVVRMPSGTNTYRGGNNDLLHSTAISNFNALGTGVNLADYDIVCVVFKQIGMTSGGIGYAGLAGGSRMWLQDSYSSGVITHEAGHNYGLDHASFWQTTDGSVVGTGSRIEYGDPFDIMGDGPIPEGHFHMQGKSELNWLSTNQWTAVSASGTYRVYRLDDRTTTAAFSRAVRITKAAAPAEYYWAGYRRLFTSNPYLNNGACLLWQRPGGDRSDLLDTTPGSAGGRDDGAVLIGRTYSDSVANVHITPIANGGSGADEWLDITVKLGPFPGNQAPTGVALTGPATVTARTTATYAVAGTDPDGDALAYAWDFGDGVPVANSVSISRSWAIGGSYTVRVTVSDMKGQVVTQTLAVTVTDPLLQWTVRASSTTADLHDICAGTNGAGTPIVLAVGCSNFFDGKVCLSTNGSNWTSAPLSESNVRMKSVVYNGQRFIAAGWGYSFALSDWVGGIWTSPDGTGNSWTRRYTGGLTTTLEGIAANGQTAVAVGEGGRLLYSTDGGTTWTPATSTATNNFSSVAWGGGRFVAVGGDPVQVFTSASGITWTDASAGAGVETWQDFSSVEYSKDRFLASGWYSKIRHSTDDGASFQTTRANTEQTPAFAFGSGVFLAAGWDRGNSDADINLISTDGAHWTPIPTTAQNDRTAAVFFKDTFITVGDGGAIWQSAPFSAPVTTLPPSATTLAATSVSGTAATLNGSANPNGLAAIGFIQWGTTTGYGQNTESVNLGNGTAAVALSAPISGLTVGQTYHFRTAASNSVGITYGSDMTFTTPGGPVAPSATTLAATSVTGTAATLKGSANPNGLAAIGFFQWGTTTGYGQNTTPSNLGNGMGPVALSAAISGLTDGQTYHFRAAASNSVGITYGSDMTFTTPTSGPLTITRSGGNVIVSWPAGLSAVLQESPTLAPAVWRNSPSGAIHPITIAATNRAMFYRLNINNDYFTNRLSIIGNSFIVSALNASATKEGGEPNHVGNSGGRSIWWTWTAPSNGSVTLSTAGSDFDTLLAVYTGTAVNALTQVAANDDFNGTVQSQVTFTATQNVTYQIAVDGYNTGTGAASGSITLNLTRP